MVEIIGSGTIHYVTPERLIASNGSKLYESQDQGDTWKEWYSLPIKITDYLFPSNRLISRFLRKEISHVEAVEEGLFVCFAFGHIYLINEDKQSVKNIGSIKGSRPLAVCTRNQGIFYGMYTRAQNHGSIPLLYYDLEGERWIEYHVFSDIRHIHGVYWDTFESKMWITTGDLNHEASIAFFIDQNNLEIVQSGSQQSRAVDLIFTETGIYYATDAPNEQNYIYRIDRKSGELRQLQAVGGPVFWGRREGNWLFFSTVVEPSNYNSLNKAELWGSPDLGESWKKILVLRKDRWNGKLFQYGQIRFPSGPGDNKYLMFSPYATQYDHKILRILIETIDS